MSTSAAVADRSRKPFFSQRATLRQIQYFAKTQALTIYAGAGVSIDMTGLSWSRLGLELLAETFDMTGLPAGIAAGLGTQRLASIAVERLISTFGAGKDDRLADALRPILYRNSHWVTGVLIPNLQSQLLTRHAQGKSTTIFTTNYDDYLDRNLDTSEFSLIVNGNPVRSVADPKGTINYLHGRIPETGPHTQVVVSEGDYAATQERVYQELKVAFESSDVLILGSSLTDPPLVRALIDSKTSALKAGFRRLALVPRQGNAVSSTPAGRELLADALHHLGCVGVFPDFYSQVGQFLGELGVCAVDPAEYAAPTSENSYSGRLDSWWREWLIEVRDDDDLVARQRSHHELLRVGLTSVRELIDADDNEPLKLEVWIRWRPRERELRLWSSSVGDWSSLDTMRTGSLDSSSKYVSVQAFCAGHPILDKPLDESERWQSYLAAPVWIRHGEGSHTGSHIAGVITLASMWHTRRSSVAIRNRGNLPYALVYLTGVAQSILT